MSETRAERQAIDAAAAIMSEERNGLGITHAGFAMTSLPPAGRQAITFSSGSETLPAWQIGLPMWR